MSLRFRSAVALCFLGYLCVAAGGFEMLKLKKLAKWAIIGKAMQPNVIPIPFPMMGGGFPPMGMPPHPGVPPMPHHAPPPPPMPYPIPVPIHHHHHHVVSMNGGEHHVVHRSRKAAK